jgi:hypothetical protein
MTIILDGTTGITTPAINSSGDLELPGGTANGVLYLNGSKVATSGSALVFDGTNLGVGTSSPAYNLNVVNSANANTTIGLTNSTSGTSALSRFLAISSAGNGWFGMTSPGYTDISSAADALVINASSASGGIVLAQDGVGQAWLNTSGNLGIGTSSPSAKLDVVGTLGIRVNEDGSGTKVLSLRSNFAGVGPAINVTTNDPLLFQTNNTERARIDSSGNLGVGTSSPSDPLSLGNGLSAGFNANSSGQTTRLRWRYTGTEYAWIERVHADGSMAFGVQSSERARIDSSGNLLVGTTSSSQQVGEGSKFISNGRLFQVSSYDANTQESLSMYSTGASAFRFYVGWGGTVYATNTSISAISDQRLKENIRDLDVGLDAVMALKPRKFDWKEGKGQDKKDVRGFIAQEFEQVFPDLVDEWKDPAPEGGEPYKSVRQDLIPVLVKAIQEQQAMIENLKAEIDQLKGT